MLFDKNRKYSLNIKIFFIFAVVILEKEEHYVMIKTNCENIWSSCVLDAGLDIKYKIRYLLAINEWYYEDIDNVAKTVKDDFTTTIETGSRLSIAAACFSYMPTRC
jgi:hypothetical protein